MSSWDTWGLTDTPEVRWRLAMAWDEWSDKITHNAPEHDGTPFGNQGSYVINHGQNQEESGLVYSLKDKGPEDNSIFIDGLYSHPQFRNQGIAEAFFRRLNQDYPDRKINPGAMTGDGEGFHDHMLEKEPRARDLVTAQRIAMAWEDYKDKIQGGCKSCYDGPGGWEGRYTIFQAGAFLNYSHGTTYKGDPVLNVIGVYTHPTDRGKGVAEALMRRLAEDHPGIPINPGYMTPDGQAFHDRVLEKEPSAKDLVTAAIRLLKALR